MENASNCPLSLYSMCSSALVHITDATVCHVEEYFKGSKSLSHKKSKMKERVMKNGVMFIYIYMLHIVYMLDIYTIYCICPRISKLLICCNLIHWKKIIKKYLKLDAFLSMYAPIPQSRILVRHLSFMMFAEQFVVCYLHFSLTRLTILSTWRNLRRLVWLS